MGQEKSKMAQALERRNAQGKEKRKNRLGDFEVGKRSLDFDWGGCAPEKLQDVVVGITDLGGAVIFGVSRDGGALSLTIMLDDERQARYFNADSDLDEGLDTISALLESVEE